MIYNVTPTMLDHECVICGAKKSQHPHEKIERVEGVGGSIVLVVECENGHRECFNNNLPAYEETSLTRDETSREQVKNVRALHRHLGLPVSD